MEEASTLRDAYERAQEYDMEEWLIGINWERIGGRCSIAVVALIGSYLLYSALMLLWRMVIVYGAEESFYLAALRACCATIHLLALDSEGRRRNRANVESGEGMEMTEMTDKAQKTTETVVTVVTEKK